VLSAITVVELMQQAKNVGSETFRYLEPITLAGLFFLVISVTFAQLVRQLEFRLRLP
jgi:polar amino acid transport system permease protein